VDKLLLIVPPNINFTDFVKPPENVKRSERKSGRSFGSVITDPPLGSISLSAFIKKHIPNCEVQVIDFNVELNKVQDFEYDSFKDYFRVALPELIKIEQPTVVGISTLFMTAYRSLIALAEVSRELYPETFLIAGGNIPTVAHKQIYQDTDLFNAVCNGEGERPLLALLKAEDKQAYVELDNCWVTKAKLATPTIFKQDAITQLDEIPFDYSSINLPDYELNPTINYYTTSEVRGKSFNIMTSRGCPFKCIFCAAHRTHGRAMRYHSLDRVKEDIRRLKEEYDIRTVTIEDDHFLGDKQRAFEIVKYLSEQDMTAFFPNALALFALDKPMLEGLRNAGLRQLVLAVESGSDRVLRHVMKKPLKLEYVSRVTKDCRELGIYTDCNILIGLPGETKEDIADSRAFLKTTGANWFRINAATPIIGSEMHEICETKNYIKKDLADSNYKKAIVETEEFTHQYIQEMIYDMNIELNFVFNSDMRMGDFKIAQGSFENVLRAKADHVLALHYLSTCSKELGDSDQASEYKKRSLMAFESDKKFWSKYVDTYGIAI